MAKNSFGAELHIGTSANSLTQIVRLTSIASPQVSRGAEDSTTHDSAGGAQEITPQGTYKVGPVEFEGEYVANDTQDTALLGYLTGATLVYWKIVDKGASANQKKTMSGYLTKYAPNAYTVNGLQTFSATLEPTGAMTQAANA